MKKMKFLFIPILVCLLFTGCEIIDDDPVNPSCQGYGSLKVTNDSNNSVHKIIIGGTWYATLGPGENQTISLAVGNHNVVFQGVNGGGCSPSWVTIVECQTEGRICRN